MEERIEKAVAKLEYKLYGIPLDEQIPENRDYMKVVNLINTLKNFKAVLARLDPMLTELGC